MSSSWRASFSAWHHGATPSWLSLILFFVLGLARGSGPKLTTASLVEIIVAGVAGGGLIILGFYLWATLADEFIHH